MTDFDTIIEMLDKVKTDYTININTSAKFTYETEIWINGQYAYTAFYFDKEGNLIELDCAS